MTQIRLTDSGGRSGDHLVGHEERDALLEEHVRRLRVAVERGDVHQRRSVL